MLTPEKLLELINEHGLGQYADAILSASKPAIHISRKRVADDKEIPVGASKLGGSPDVPVDFVWPQWNGTPLTFISQFRLSEVAPFDVEHVLPTTGMLSFFYAVDAGTWGFPDEYGSWRVLFTENEFVPLQRNPHPITPGKYEEIRPLLACAVTFAQTLTVPVLQTDFGGPRGHTFFGHGRSQSTYQISEDAIDGFREMQSEAEKLNKPLHQLLGNPYEIQGDIRYSCQEHSNAIGQEITQSDTSSISTVEEGMKDWRLLLQIDSDMDEDNNGLGIMWGDVGLLYYCIKYDALERRDFESCWFIMEMG